jgi:hypothetical protein
MKNAPARPEGRRAEAHNQQPQINSSLAPAQHRPRSCHIKQAVYDGRTALGTVELINDASIASTGEVVGSFDTLVAAARSFPTREDAR